MDMNETQRFKRFPAIRCWIKHLLEGSYSSEEKFLYTIFGKVKRIRIIATIVDKREIVSAPVSNENSSLETDDDSNLRIEFDLDDSTGVIRAIIWQANPDQYMDFKRGDIVDIVGLFRKSGDYISISPEIIKKVKDPNLILLRNAEIIRMIKSGDIQEIPEISKESKDIDEFDVYSLFEGEGVDIKENIYSLIEHSTSDGNGISFKKILESVNISDEDLKKHIRDLVMESRIYESDEGIYQSYT